MIKKMAPHAGRRVGSAAISDAASRDELFQAAVAILMSGRNGKVPERVPVPWDFEIENDFRGPTKLLSHAEARQFAEKIARNYRDARARETAAVGLTQVLRKFREIETRADLLRRAISTLTVDEYRLIHIGAEKEHDPSSADLYRNYVALRDLLFPRDWENAFSKTRPSGLSDHVASISSFFSQLSLALAEKHGFQLVIQIRVEKQNRST